MTIARRTDADKNTITHTKFKKHKEVEKNSIEVTFYTGVSYNEYNNIK